MKFTMFAKETKDKEDCSNPFRKVHFKRDEDVNPICPNGKCFFFKYNKHIYKNKYGRTQ